MGPPVKPVPVETLVTGLVPEDAAVNRPCASTVNAPYVYDPAVTAVLASDTVSPCWDASSYS
jgi:hypothetical protein